MVLPFRNTTLIHSLMLHFSGSAGLCGRSSSPMTRRSLAALLAILLMALVSACHDGSSGDAPGSNEHSPAMTWDAGSWDKADWT